jgi:hypothetical protein
LDDLEAELCPQGGFPAAGVDQFIVRVWPLVAAHASAGARSPTC